MGRLNWGAETWTFGDKWFEIVAGDGSDIAVKAVEGIVSVARQPGSAPLNMREALVSITADALINAPVAGKEVSAPPNTNHSLSMNLVDVIVKQMGDAPQHVTFRREFPDPVLLPGGRVKLLISTYVENAAGEITGPDVEAADTEVQCTLLW